jgi:thiamine-phosphate pyrophosphorylase
MKNHLELYRQRLMKFINEVSVYPVSCEKLANGRTDLEWLDAVLAGGARIVQLRDKESDDRTLYEKAVIFRQKTKEAGALFMVNNRFDIALLADADGVHLGNSDLPAQDVRRMCPHLLIGVSCNEREQVDTAEGRGASYYNIGPLFHTDTKKKLSPFLGLDAIETFSARSSLPFTVMGGIKLNHVPELVKRNAQRIAVVTALTQAKDIARETRAWVDTIRKYENS